MLVVLAAALTAVSVLMLGLAPVGIRRLGEGSGSAGGGGSGGPHGEDAVAAGWGTLGDGRPWPAWSAPAASGVAGVALWALLGGIPGVVAGAAAALLGPRLLGRLETGARRRQRLALVAGAPLVAELLAASLAAGVPVDRAMPVIARAMGAPVGEALDLVSARIGLGEPADMAWARVADVPGLGTIAATVARSARTGAPLAGMLMVTADDLRARAAAAALAEVRATSVRAVLPLGLCLLPAFALLGILPVIAGLIPEI